MAGGKGSERYMKMGRLADESGVPVSTIKFYLSRGLLPRPRKTSPNVAYYDEAFLERLLTIRKMRSDGISVSSIKAILDRHRFEKVSEWEEFKKNAKKKRASELDAEERLAALSDEERRRADILDAALRVFSTKGYHNSTVDDIADRAGVSKGTCYQYFSGKEEILVAVMNRTLEAISAEAEAASEEIDDALARLGLKGLTFISKYRDLQFIMMGLYTEILGGNRELKKEARGALERIADFLAEDIRTGIRQGALRDVEALPVAYALIGIAEAAGSRYLVDDNFDAVQFFVHLVDFLQHGLSKNG